MGRQPWQEWELELLRDVSLSLKEVAERTGRPAHGVENRAYRLGVRRKAPHGMGRESYALTSRTCWSEAELATVDDKSLSYSEVEQLTGRSHTAVLIMAERRGVHRPYWSQPGYRSERTDYRGEDWPEVRKDILARDGYTCQDGGEFVPSGKGLVVHHMIPWRLRASNDSRWLVTLCQSHHMQRPEHLWTEIPEDILLLLSEGR